MPTKRARAGEKKRGKVRKKHGKKGCFFDSGAEKGPKGPKGEKVILLTALFHLVRILLHYRVMERICA
jgi:hypothetical protein